MHKGEVAKGNPPRITTEPKRTKAKGLKKEKEQRFAPTFVNLKSNTMKKIT